MKQQYNTALYLRLSRDDDLQGESGSISTQRDMLTQYCREQNLNIVGEYVDDGWSGTNFDRPNFQRMIGLAKSKEHPFDVILVWKFSRFARNQEESILYKNLLKKECNVEVVSISEFHDLEHLVYGLVFVL